MRMEKSNLGMNKKATCWTPYSPGFDPHLLQLPHYWFFSGISLDPPYALYQRKWNTFSCHTNPYDNHVLIDTLNSSPIVMFVLLANTFEILTPKRNFPGMPESDTVSDATNTEFSRVLYFDSPPLNVGVRTIKPVSM